MSEQISAPFRAERLPMGQALLVPLAGVLVTGAVWLWVTLETPVGSRLLVGIAGGITSALLCAAVAVATYRNRKVRQAEIHARAMEGELSQLVDHILPSVVRRLREGASSDTVIAEVPRPVSETHQRILRTLTREISYGERRRAAAMAACGNAAGRVQALATSMLADLREMEDRYSDEVLGDLLKLDHSTAQTGRLADSIAVLTGARSGRRWTKPIVMESILRGAMGRIGAYQRVHVHSTSGAAVAGYAAEDVMHALAELMDNATRFSAPSEEVHVYVEDLHNGAVITIEDGGLGMKPQALERAEIAVSSSQPLDLTQLSGTRLGLAVVGCLARKHQLQVFFRPSSRGGTGVVLRIPNQLITQPRQQNVPVKQRQPEARQSTELPTRVPSARHRASAQERESAEGGVSVATEPAEPLSLPKRPRGQTLTAATRPPSPGSPAPSPRPRLDAGTRFGAFRQARARNPEGGSAGSSDDATD